MLQVDEAERERARRAIHAGEVGFVEWVEQVGGVVDTDGLVPFTRWVTPTNVPRRFTTQMYVYFWPLRKGAADGGGGGLLREAVIPTPTSDGGLEHTAAVFQSCAEWVGQARRNEVIMFPPQFYLTWLLGKFLVGGTDGAELQRQREEARAFIRGGGGNGVEWAEKVMSPVAVGQLDGRAVLGLDHPGPELKGSGRRGEDGDVVLVRFSREGPRDVDVRPAKEVKKLLREAQAKI
jgi:hypothetical protein